MGHVIAVRRFHQPPTNRTVTARIGEPRRSGRDWFAPVEIRGLGPVETLYAYGVDALQALMIACEFLRTRLASATPPLRWLDGLPPGDLGLPRQLPDLGFPDLRARLDRAVDREINLWAAALERRQRRRRRGRAQQ